MKIITLFFILTLLFLSQSVAQELNMTLNSPVFKDNEIIPHRYTCNGSGVNPPLNIKRLPIGTKSLVLLLRDLDEPNGDRTYWLVYNITPDTKTIAEDSIPGSEILNDFNKFHYEAPCPKDERIHQYVFELFALNTIYILNPNGSVQGFLQKIEDHILAKASLIGTYKNPSHNTNQ